MLSQPVPNTTLPFSTVPSDRAELDAAHCLNAACLSPHFFGNRPTTIWRNDQGVETVSRSRRIPLSLIFLYDL